MKFGPEIPRWPDVGTNPTDELITSGLLVIHSVGYSLAPMAPDNTALGGTRFTVSIDAKERDVTTGISASFAVSPLHCSIFSTRHDVVPAKGISYLSMDTTSIYEPFKIPMGLAAGQVVSRIHWTSGSL